MAKKNKRLKHTRSRQLKTKHVTTLHGVSSPLAIFQRALTLHQNNRLGEAEVLYRQALNLKPDYIEAHYNLGIALFGQYKLDEAADSFHRALTLKPDYVEAHFNLGVVLQDIGKLEEAAASYQKAIKLKPDYADAYKNLGTTFYSLCKLNEAVRFLQLGIENVPGDTHVSDALIDLLNNYMPDLDIDSSYIKAQKSLQQLCKEYTTTFKINDDTVRKLYKQANDILAMQELEITSNIKQLFRGVIHKNNCQRHKVVFNTFNIIPKYCFNCIKVTIEPQTVVQLLKLLFVFDKIKLPNDNQRKCIVEDRLKIPGKYKGFIYCKDRDEAKQIINIIQPILDVTIAKGIPIYAKRGCSEFQVAYPGFSYVNDNEVSQISYNAEWYKYETYVDKIMKIKPFQNPNNFTNNHTGFTLLDILVMRNWLAFAAKIGDLTYRKITG